jgi:hypothetical protein
MALVVDLVLMEAMIIVVVVVEETAAILGPEVIARAVGEVVLVVQVTTAVRLALVMVVAVVTRCRQLD